MKVFKWFDLGAQILIVVGWLVYIIGSSSETSHFIIVYFLLGGCQLLSFLVHLSLNESWIDQENRSLYGKFIFWLIVTGLAMFLVLLAVAPFFLLYLFGLLIISPVLAAWYFSIGLKELGLIKQRELTQLK